MRSGQKGPKRIPRNAGIRRHIFGQILQGYHTECKCLTPQSVESTPIFTRFYQEIDEYGEGNRSPASQHNPKDPSSPDE